MKKFTFKGEFLAKDMDDAMRYLAETLDAHAHDSVDATTVKEDSVRKLVFRVEGEGGALYMVA